MVLMYIVVVRKLLEPLKIIGPFRSQFEAKEFAGEYACDLEADTRVQRVEPPTGYEPGL